MKRPVKVMTTALAALLFSIGLSTKAEAAFVLLGLAMYGTGLWIVRPRSPR